MIEALPASLQTWRAAGKLLLADGVELFFREQGDGPPLVCFHGFPTSSWDWHRVLPLLSQSFRVIIFDFPGYGLSAKPPDRDYSVLRQMDAVESLLGQLGVRRFHLLSHDMGDTVACELIYRMRENLTDLEMDRWIILNGGIYTDLHQPLLTQRLLRTPIVGEITARLASRRVFDWQFPNVYANPEQFNPEHYDCQWALLQHAGGRKVLAKVAVYMRERLKYADRWLDSLHQWQGPVRIIWGRHDPIAVPAIAERLAPRLSDAKLVVMEDLGHYPQLEGPEDTATKILEFLS